MVSDRMVKKSVLAQRGAAGVSSEPSSCVRGGPGFSRFDRPINCDNVFVQPSCSLYLLAVLWLSSSTSYMVCYRYIRCYNIHS
jgi:hypothetical protein